MAGLFGANWREPLFQVVGATFDILALVGIFGIAYNYAKNEECEPVSAGILALVSFLIVTASSVTAKGGEVVGGVTPQSLDRWERYDCGDLRLAWPLCVYIHLVYQCKLADYDQIAGRSSPGLCNAFFGIDPGSSCYHVVLFESIFSLRVWQGKGVREFIRFCRHRCKG